MNATFVQSHFERNPQTNIVVTAGDLVVRNSTFTDGKGSHIRGVQASVILDNVHIYNSTEAVN